FRRDVPKPTRALHQTASLFDHLVGARQQRHGHVEAQGSCGLEVYREFEFCRLLHGQIGRLLAPENTINVGGGLPEEVRRIQSVTYQTARSDEPPSAIYHRKTMRGSQSDDQIANGRAFDVNVAWNHQTTLGFTRQRLEYALDLRHLPNWSSNGRYRQRGCELVE